MTRAFITILLGLTLNSAAFARSMDLSALPAPIRENLLKTLPDLQKKEPRGADIDQALRVLQRDTSVEQAIAKDLGGGVVQLSVRMAKRIASVEISGLNEMSESDARAALLLNKNDTYDQDALVEAGERLRLAYRDRGVLNPVFEIETPEESPGKIDLRIKVTEGPVTRITTWEVQSADRELNARLQKMLHSKVKGAYTEARLQDAANRLRQELRLKRHLRADLTGPETQFSADETSARVTFRLERIESYTVDFRGNKDLNSRILEDDILDLKNFATTNPNIASEMTEMIRKAYLARGYARVEVTSEETEGSTPFARRITFTVNEGPIIRIDAFEVKGRISRSSSYYAEIIQDHSSKLIQSGYYNKDDLENGFKNLAIELQNEGFLVAKIVSTRAQYNRERTRITIHVNLDEGPLTLVESISFQGNAKIQSVDLLSRLDLEPGKALKLNQIEESINNLKSFYQDKGYIEMQLLNEKADLVQYNEDNTRASLVFKIQEGPQVTVASILVDGNTFTKEKVILNELDFEVGELLTPTKIEESTSRLQRTGHFGSVEIKTLEEKTAVENRTVIIRVSERNPGIFNIGAGATNERQLTLRGYTGISYRNLMGTGRGVSLRVEGNYNIADVKYPEHKIVLGYLEPSLFNTRNRGRVNLTRSKQVTDYDLRKVTELNQITYSVERDFTSHVIGAWDVWSLSTYIDSFLRDDKPRVDLEIASTILRLDLDYRDNPFNPTKGNLTKLSVEYSSPKIGSVKSDEFWRSSASYSFYVGLGNTSIVWANSFRAGLLQSATHGLDGGVPYDKVGFVLGGRSTVRGYEAGTSEVFPNNTDLGGTDAYRLVTQAQMGLFKSEFRFPVWGEELSGALFYDGGIVEIEGLKFADAYRDSAGFGIRYNTPVGPLSLEWGFKLDRRAGEEPWRFHLSMGTF